ncbi:hypothetical protein [Chryseosolibacter indicus]|uniref:Uncharacterized protein n=1 Tax=Chryseosolibacter indicus TaxID=2782351 RepID=A0ABS5VN78_9BACT|nr:hypothetical protein [Chryseosolibacter indicus]MBT1702217.1 hypothetical protein [Chryseosolibacter indicus]
MKRINTKKIFSYLYEQLTGNFTGFLIGASATGLVSQFFETRSIRNLWGLTAKKTVVNKETFQDLEWIVSIIIGFIVFEIITKVVKERIDKNFPKYKMITYRWVIRKDIRNRFRSFSAFATDRGIAFFAAVHQGVKQGINQYSRRN